MVSYHMDINDRGESKKQNFALRMMNFCKLQDPNTLTVLKLGYKGKYSVLSSKFTSCYIISVFMGDR